LTKRPLIKLALLETKAIERDRKMDSPGTLGDVGTSDIRPALAFVAVRHLNWLRRPHVHNLYENERPISQRHKSCFKPCCASRFLVHSRSPSKFLEGTLHRATNATRNTQSLQFDRGVSAPGARSGRRENRRRSGSAIPDLTGASACAAGRWFESLYLGCYGVYNPRGRHHLNLFSLFPQFICTSRLTFRSQINSPKEFICQRSHGRSPFASQLYRSTHNEDDDLPHMRC
jgi:hypothetical protein